MTTSTCCKKSKDEQLYMLELLVDRLNLTPEKIQQIGSTPLSLRLQFLDFPVFEVNEEEFWSSKKRREKLTTLLSDRKSVNGSLDFSAGKSCLFPKKPSELVESMRLRPLKVEVHKFTEKKPCKSDENETPVCKTEIPLSGCLCDQVAMAMNDPYHLPKPYTSRNTWNLTDEDGKPSGTILLLLRLTCLGKSVVTQFAVHEKSLLFKNCDSSNEFQCSKVLEDEEEIAGKGLLNNICMPERYKKPEEDDKPKARNLIGLAPVCKELSKRDGGALEIIPQIKLSTYRSIEEKCSEKIFETKNKCAFYPGGNLMEFPCAPSFCEGALCTGNKSLISFNPGNYFSSEKADYCYKPRMRGGGCFGEETNDFHKELTKQSTSALISGSCKSPRKNDRNSSKPGCGCFGKSGTGMMGIKSPGMKSGGSCMNNPCLGVDCLIRAFKETQEFVDSIGKVPGLAGLGLMDPSESPFFGRERDEAPTSCGPQIGVSTMPGLHSAALRNVQPTKKYESSPISTILPALASNVHQTETQAQFPGRLKKKGEERSDKQRESQEVNHQAIVEGETGPCAEPRCKSRKKKPQEETSNDASTFNLQAETKKASLGNKWQASRVGRTRVRGKSRVSSVPGSAGDRHSSQRISHIRVSKRIMRLVNAMRDPRYCHGHKNCLDVRIRVPGNMGWLWNSNDVPGRLKTPIGWKPGAISKFVWDRLQEAKAATAESATTSESRPTTPSKGKRGKALRIKSLHSLGRSQWARNRLLERDDEEIELPPTLHIHRKDGTYYVTMYPIKAENLNNPELQEAVKPLQFKITKDKDDGSVCSSSTASDMEIEFSPPAAISRYTKKVETEDRSTQVSQQEILEALKVPGSKRQSKSKKSKIKK